MNLAAVARRFNDLPLFPYLEEDPPYADVPYAYGYKDYRNHLAVEAAVSNAAWASTVEAAGAAAAAAAGIDPDIYNFLVSLDFLDFDPLNLPPDLNAARLWIYLPAKDVGDAIARQFLLEGDMLMQRWPENGLPDAIADVAARRVQEFGGLWGAAARAARTARAEWGADTEYIRGLVNALTETFSDEESKEPVPDQQSK